ncbi:MAG: VOC family protein [Clostridium sp.]|jgi:predicted enzyme related to lactoylglutathione lyase|nr:VOC family protein [Clostridium sp.]
MSKLTIGDLSIDCTDPLRAQNFYANLMNWEKLTAFGCPAVKTEIGMLILFTTPEVHYVSPVWPEEVGKQQKQMHFNFQVDDLQSTVTEALALGATKAKEQFGGDQFVTLIDPAGHPFCLCRK